MNGLGIQIANEPHDLNVKIESLLLSRQRQLIIFRLSDEISSFLCRLSKYHLTNSFFGLWTIKRSSWNFPLYCKHQFLKLLYSF